MLSYTVIFDISVTEDHITTDSRGKGAFCARICLKKLNQKIEREQCIEGGTIIWGMCILQCLWELFPP